MLDFSLPLNLLQFTVLTHNWAGKISVCLRIFCRKLSQKRLLVILHSSHIVCELLVSLSSCFCFSVRTQGGWKTKNKTMLLLPSDFPQNLLLTFSAIKKKKWCIKVKSTCKKVNNFVFLELLEMLLSHCWLALLSFWEVGG